MPYFTGMLYLTSILILIGKLAVYAVGAFICYRGMSRSNSLIYKCGIIFFALLFVTDAALIAMRFLPVSLGSLAGIIIGAGTFYLELGAYTIIIFGIYKTMKKRQEPDCDF